ncbi:MAG: ribonuclease P [Candidatus Aenigmarchaeota archaeon]|nr:ribonuclease P [Candidatus Aenigmarchaeota archaeon]
MPQRMGRQKPEWQRKLAQERIAVLFRIAGGEFGRNPERSHRCMLAIRRLAMRYNIRLQKNIKKGMCKGCHRYIRPGVNCTVRTKPERQAVIITCRECGRVMRYPYVRERRR